MTTLEKRKRNTDGGAMFKVKNQVEGIDFMKYSDDVKIITTQYRANNKNIGAKFDQIRQEYDRSNPNRANSIKQIDMINRATKWAKANNVKAEKIKLKRGKVLKGLDNTRIGRADYAEIGTSYLNSIDKTIWQVEQNLTMDNLIETTGNRDKNEYRAIFYDKLLSLLLKYAEAFSSVFSSCGKCETVIDIVKQAIKQNVKTDCLKNPDVLSVDRTPDNMPSNPYYSQPPTPSVVTEPPAALPEEYKPINTGKQYGTFESVVDEKALPYMDKPITKYFIGTSTEEEIKEFKKIIIESIDSSTLNDKEKSVIKTKIDQIPYKQNDSKGVDDLKSLAYVYTTFQLETLNHSIKIQDEGNQKLSQLKIYSLLNNLKNHQLYAVFKKAIDTINRDDLPKITYIEAAGRDWQDVGNLLGYEFDDPFKSIKGRYDDRLRTWFETPGIFADNFNEQTGVFTSLKLSYTDIDQLLNKNSDLYNGRDYKYQPTETIQGNVALAPELKYNFDHRPEEERMGESDMLFGKQGGRRTKRHNKKYRSTFKRRRIGKTLKNKVKKSHKKKTYKK
jgi:hypothetical protein